MQRERHQLVVIENVVGANGTNSVTLSSDFNVAYGLGNPDTFNSAAGADYFIGVVESMYGRLSDTDTQSRRAFCAGSCATGMCDVASALLLPFLH